jgi:hypothetical protein
MNNTMLEKSILDDAHALTKGAVSCIPLIGGIASELFGIVVTPPLEKRRQSWMQQITRDLDELRNTFENFSWDQLASNEAFLDVFLHASQIALRNHQEEKIIAL